MTIYERIKALRIAKGLSQAELAKLVGYEGRSAISKVEAGSRDISQSMIEKYAVALGTTPTYLLYGDEDEAETPLTNEAVFSALFSQLSPEHQGIIIAQIQGILATYDKKGSGKTKDNMERIWYSRVNDGYTGGIDHQHYNITRYHGINLHAFFTKGTIEFRLFNGTTDADKIIAYAQFCLAMSAWAINADDRMSYRNCSEYTAAQKERLMTSVLVNRLGMVGNEYKAARRILTEAFRAA